MSSPSTPQTARSAPPSGAGSPEILTPGRKIKAMLAAFDSDSDSDKEGLKPRLPNVQSNTDTDANEDKNEEDGVIAPRGRMAARMQDQAQTDSKESSGASETAFERLSRRLRNMEQNEDEDEEDETDDIIVPRGRMAARMQDQVQTHKRASSGVKAPEIPFESSSRKLMGGKTNAARYSKGEDADSSDDQLPTARPRRRLVKTNESGAGEGSPSPARSVSPLFVSPTARSDNDNSDNTESRPKANSRFLALVAQKRREREEKERLEADKKASRVAQLQQFSSEILSGDESEDDGDTGRKLTKQSRPSRKASKKALEEMNRETQRMSRNMQLAHQATTRKKITKESFFARFNFMQPQELDRAGKNHASSSATGSCNSSDDEAGKDRETPHTSPVLGPADKRPVHEHIDSQAPPLDKDNTDAALENFPTFEEILAAPQQKLHQEPIIVASAATKAQELQPEASERKHERKLLTKPPVRVHLSRQLVSQHQKEDSDSDLEVVTSPAKSRRIAAFENLPARKKQEPSSLLKLKALAHLSSPSRRTSSMTQAELSATLLYQAKQQSAKQRQERIQELRAKGIIIETAEERAAMEDEVEDLMEKARKEAEDIARKERKISKEGQEGDEEDGEDDDEDDDYEMSGSDEDFNGADADEEEGDEDKEDRADVNEGEQGLVDVEADEDDESEDDQTEAVLSDEEPANPIPRRKRPTRVISDDEDEAPEPKTPARPAFQTSHSVERPQLPPGLGTSDDLTMSLTQAFAGTLAENQTAGAENSQAILLSLPDPGRTATEFQEPDSQILVRDSQERSAETPDILTRYSQNDYRVSESPALQYSQIPDPTQDAGFVLSQFDPLKRFVGTPPSTVETVLLPHHESPMAGRKGKHLRRGRVAQLSDVEEEMENGFEIEASAFDIMKKAAKKPSVPFDRNKSKAKEIVDEVAEESEDEYAGLGGASDESEDDENEYDKEIVNDNSGEVVDEKELAALNAMHQREADEKQVARLMKDITTGALRRRMGAEDDFDLDDSDDERMARRRAKQREFARMRKALLADEKVGELAENPKKAAFFRAIEDRDVEDDFDLDFLDEESGPHSQQDSSSQDVGTEGQNEDRQNNKRKRPFEPSAADIANRPSPHLRRTKASGLSKRPTTLAEIRETLSFLTEQPEYDSFHEDAAMDVDENPADDMEDTDTSHEVQSARRLSDDGFAIPTHPRRTRGPVVDRLALLRQASSNSASAASALTTARPAFHSGSDVDFANVGFRPPTLIRRATASSTSSSGSSVTSTTSRVPKAAAGPTVAKKGAVNYYTAARERERERELKAKQRSGPSSISALLSKRSSLGAIGGKGQWD